MTRTPASLGRAAAVILIAGAAVLGTASPALAHDQLLETKLVPDETDGAVEAVTLTFNNSIIEVGTEIVIKDADGESVADGTPKVSGPEVTQPLAKDLEPGTYDAAWRVVSSDGHPIEGQFGIQIEADPAGDAIVEADPRFTENPAAAATAGSDDSGASDASESASDSKKDTASDDSRFAVTAALIGGVAVIGVAAAIVIVRVRRTRSHR